MRIVYPDGLNKGFGSKFREGSRVRQEGSRVRQETPEKGRRADQPKRWVYNNNDEDNSKKNPDNTMQGLL